MCACLLPPPTRNHTPSNNNKKTKNKTPSKVEWVDNQACLDVIEAMPPRGLGVLAVLDSQCRVPRADDGTLVVALKDALEGVNDHFGTHPRRQDEFVLQHYAGPVSYCVAGFLDKNKDTLSAGEREVMRERE